MKEMTISWPGREGKTDGQVSVGGGLDGLLAGLTYGMGMIFGQEVEVRK